MAKEKDEEKETPGGAADPDEDFFKERGIDDPEERDVIRKRASVLAYHEYAKTKAEKASKDKGKAKKGARWFDKD